MHFGPAGILGTAILIGSSAAAAQAAPAWHAAESLRLGEARGPEYEFDFPIIAVGPRGEIAVRRVHERRIDVFDSTGARLRSIGRDGSGPGEFRSITGIRWVNDTIFARDWNEHRLTAFRPDGIVAWVHRMPDAPRDRDWSIYDEAEMLANGLLVTDRVPNTRYRGDLPILLIDTSGSTHREITRLVDGPVLLPLRGGIALGYQPWQDRSLWTARADGHGFVVVDRKVTGGTPRFRVRAWDAGGTVTLDRRYDYTPIPISRREADSVVGVARYKWSAEGIGPGVAAVLPQVDPDAFAKGLYVPAHRPPVTDVVATRDGGIWLRREETGTPGVRWDVMNPAGSVIGSVTLPLNFRLFDADHTHIWGVETIEFGVQEIVRYTIVR